MRTAIEVVMCTVLLIGGVSTVVTGTTWLPSAVGVLLIAVGACVVGLGVRRWSTYRSALRSLSAPGDIEDAA